MTTQSTPSDIQNGTQTIWVPTTSRESKQTPLKRRQLALHQAACEYVFAECCKQSVQLSDPTIGGLAGKEVYGVFISLKRNGKLRACVGFSGRKSRIDQGMAYAANKCVHHDPRFPPVRANELAGLDVEVWLLGDLIALESPAKLRYREIKIGRDGLLIAFKNQRGLLLPGVAVAHRLDAHSFLEHVCLKAGLFKHAWRSEHATMYRFEGQSVKAKFKLSNPRASVAPATNDNPDLPALPLLQDLTERWPAFNGRFYPNEMQQCIDELERLDPGPCIATHHHAMIPHAGWRFSGVTAMATLRRVKLASTTIILAPKHTQFGSDLSIAPFANWRTPLGRVSIDHDACQRIINEVGFSWDAASHVSEHSIEVLIPMLQFLQPGTRIVPILIASGNLLTLMKIGQRLASYLSSTSAQDVSMLVSSDMNHFESVSETKRKDQLAIEAMKSGNPQQLFHAVRSNRISMCGMGPAVVALQALSNTPTSGPIRLVKYATSADVSHDQERVVGYAGMLL